MTALDAMIEAIDNPLQDQFRKDVNKALRDHVWRDVGEHFALVGSLAREEFRSYANFVKSDV
jgi:hypothetical protein